MKQKLLKEIEDTGGVLYEGDFSKLITIDDEYDDDKLFNIIESLAEMGWLLASVHHKKDKLVLVKLHLTGTVGFPLFFFR